MRISDWSSDVCSSDLLAHAKVTGRVRREDETQEAFVGTRQGADQIHALVGDIGQEAHIALAVGKAPVISRSEEHTSELQSLMRISYAVFCLKKKTTQPYTPHAQHTTHYRNIIV